MLLAILQILTIVVIVGAAGCFIATWWNNRQWRKEDSLERVQEHQSAVVDGQPMLEVEVVHSANG